MLSFYFPFHYFLPPSHHPFFPFFLLPTISFVLSFCFLPGQAPGGKTHKSTGASLTLRLPWVFNSDTCSPRASSNSSITVCGPTLVLVPVEVFALAIYESLHHLFFQFWGAAASPMTLILWQIWVFESSWFLVQLLSFEDGSDYLPFPYKLDQKLAASEAHF